jgi:hypothetical protein
VVWMRCGCGADADVFFQNACRCVADADVFFKMFADPVRMRMKELLSVSTFGHTAAWRQLTKLKLA